MAPTFLHGRLSIEVIAARNVENRTGKGGFFRNMKDKVRGTGEGIDPYCSVRVAYVNVAQTRVVWYVMCILSVFYVLLNDF